MDDAAQLAACLFRAGGLTIPAERTQLLNRFLQDEQNKELLDDIRQKGDRLMANWKVAERIADILQQAVRIPNATVGKPYEAKIDFAQLNWEDITESGFTGLEEIGLQYEESTGAIKGVPTESGDRKLVFRYKVEGQPPEAPFNEKPLTLIINPDPKTLWKTLESDKSDPYWKEDNQTLMVPLGDRHLLVSSKRGRSHANTGGFREDDFAYADLDNGWSIVAVSDGAGSARLSRKGSAIACTETVNYFREPAAAESLAGFDDILHHYTNQPGAEAEKGLNRFVYNNLGKAAFHVHKKLEEFAKGKNASLKDLSATLIFVLWKKYAAGYVFLSFGVGDCPIALLNKEVTEVTLMNWLDVGEFGGGTRFITMPEVFQSEKFATRFGFRFVPGFSYLVLMSDGIYDPKFVVEAALPKIEKWQAFLADLDGANEEGIRVELSPGNKEIEAQFSRWMDFWSPGNHDDRTLAIVF